MARPKHYQSPEEARRVSVHQIAREVGWSDERTSRWLRRNAWWVGAGAQGFPPTYDARVIEVIHALHGREHRPITAAGQDWLSDYLRGGNPHA